MASQAVEPPTAPGGAVERSGKAWELYERHHKILWAAGLVLPILVVAIGLVVLPQVFYDRFLWEHIWGSAVADATNQSVSYHGIVATEDYTLGAEIVYGAIMAVSLYGVYVHVLRRFQVKIDAWFVAAVLPFILFGPVTRTLEDTGMFCKPSGLVWPGCDPSPLAFAFISPFLYAQIAAYVLLFMGLGIALERSTAPKSAKAMLMAGVFGATFGIYGMLSIAEGSQVKAMAPVGVVLASCALGLGLFLLLQRRNANPVNSSLASGGIAFLIPGIWMLGVWVSGRPWNPPLNTLHLEATPYVLGLPFLTVLAVAATGVLGRRVKPELGAFAVPLNLGIVYGHMLDGFASFIAICSNALGACSGAAIFGLTLPSYGEKHPVSNALLGFGNGWLFPVIKLALVLAIIWALDIAYKKDLERDRQLGGLVKMAILVLGLAPGLRDYLRLALGT